MAKATTTVRQVLNHKPAYGAWFAATQALFNCVAAFYFEVIQAHEKVLELGDQEALTALEQLTHTTKKNPHPLMPLSDIAEAIPAMFRRAAIHAALGSARSFATHLRKWRARKAKAQSKGKKWTSRPPVPPRSWNKSATFYTGQWKERTEHSIVLKVWTGTCWSWLKVRLTGRETPFSPRHLLGGPGEQIEKGAKETEEAGAREKPVGRGSRTNGGTVMQVACLQTNGSPSTISVWFGIVHHARVWPLGWRVMPGQSAWEQSP